MKRIKQQKEKKFYKIRRILDGKYSTGGGGPYVRWSDNGKIWHGLGPLRNHIALLTDNIDTLKTNSKNPNIYHPYNDCEVVEFEMVTRDKIPATEEIIGYYERKKVKENKRNAYRLH